MVQGIVLLSSMGSRVECVIIQEVLDKVSLACSIECPSDIELAYMEAHRHATGVYLVAFV